MSGLILFSCKKDFLNTQPLDQVSANVTWTDGALAEAFVNGVYNYSDPSDYTWAAKEGLGVGGFDEQMLASLTDEAVFTHAGRGINTVTEGTLNPSNLGWVNRSYEWNVMYRRIRAANSALENLAISTFDNDDLKARLRGEVHFLRGYYYQQLLRTYGGVPLVTKTYGLGEDYSIERSSFADCVDFIVKECDSAAILLDGRTMDKGRASKIAALALKSRILLYAASDLYDVPTAAGKSSTLSSYSNPELIGYTSGDRVARWQAAKDAAKAVLDAGGGGYKLDLAAPASKEDAIANYISISMGGGSKAPGVDASAKIELLFERDFNTDLDEFGGVYVGLSNGPNGYHNWAGNSPIQELVDDYEMMDGSKFDWSDPDQKAHPYVDRDPRFYATILYDGSDWKPRDLISGSVDPANQIQTGQYQVGASMIPGLDTRQSSIENWNGSWTGYYMRKFIDPNPAIVDNTTRAVVPWPFFRYTEAVFNYAEASNELGLDDEAKLWLNKIRFRAGMPALTETGDALRQRLRNEKRIEMAYEEQRYYDARRWMIGSMLGRKTVYVAVEGKLKAGQTAPSPYKHDETVYDYTYIPTEVNSLENRQWVDKMYFRPIGRDEINRNTKLVQNPGY